MHDEGEIDLKLKASNLSWSIESAAARRSSNRTNGSNSSNNTTAELSAAARPPILLRGTVTNLIALQNEFQVGVRLGRA